MERSVRLAARGVSRSCASLPDLESTMKDLTPRHIQKDESDWLGIKPGWYGAKVNGTLVTGPWASSEECLKKIGQLPEPALQTH
jgi:hypothetical protein